MKTKERDVSMYSLVADKQEAELAAAVEAANKWQTVARPIVLAMLKMDEVTEETLWPLRERDERGRRDYNEAVKPVRDARRELEQMLDGIRDDFRADNAKSWTTNLSEAEGEYVDVFNDALDEQVVSARDFVKRVEREEYDAWLQGKAA